MAEKPDAARPPKTTMTSAFSVGNGKVTDFNPDLPSERLAIGFQFPFSRAKQFL